MEKTTPPNSPGFNRKPKLKKRYSGSRKHNSHKSGNSIFETPNEATAWLYGTMFLMAAAKLLAPFMGLASVANPTTNVTSD